MAVLSLTSARHMLFHVNAPATLGLIILSAVLFTGYINIRSKRRLLPPGPTGLPILGNVLQLGQYPWLTFTAWKDKYGPIMYLDCAGQPLIVLNTLKTAADLLDRKSGVTSDRPRLIVAEMMTGGLFMAFLGHNALWRRMRKAAQEGLRRDSQRFGPTQYKEAIDLATNILTEPEEWFSHFGRTVASTMMPVVYGKTPLAKADTTITKFHDFSNTLTRAAMPGAFLVEIFPLLRHIPSRSAPYALGDYVSLAVADELTTHNRFAPWKRQAEKFFVDHSHLFSTLVDDTRMSLKQGDRSHSLVRSLIEEGQRYGISDTESYWTAATAFSGGQTAVGVLAWWMMAMVVFPETQRRAQEELDRIVGRDRVPLLDDCNQLYYIQAMVKESIRWRPVGPLSIPHSTSEDIWYKGYFIPKGSLLMPNVWAINRNPGTFGPDAHLFNPARHLDAETGKLKAAPADTKEESHLTFGFGRRICVGRHIANNMLLIQLVLMLWAMNIEPGRRPDGEYVAIDVDGCIDDGLVVRPIPFGVTITPRFSAALSKLQSSQKSLSSEE